MFQTNQSPDGQAGFTLVIERIFEVPRERVWAAWTDRKQVLKWLSPRGFTVSEHGGEVCVGEDHYHCMISPEGQESRYAGKYLEVKEPEKLVFTHIWQTDVCSTPGFETICTVLLEETESGGTKMIFTQTGIHSADSRDNQNGGWSSCFDSLAELLLK